MLAVMDLTGFATAQGGVYCLDLHCSSSRVLCKGSVPSGSCFMQFPGLSCSGSQVLQRGTDPEELCIFCPSQVRVAQETRCLAGALSQVGRLSYSPPRSQSLSVPGAPQGHSPRRIVCLLWGADLRLWHSWQMPTVQDPRKTWLATGNLLTVWWKMRSLGLGLKQPLAFWLWLLHACPSASGEGGPIQQQACSPFVFSKSFVLWAH